MEDQYLRTPSSQTQKVSVRSHNVSSWVVPKPRQHENRLQTRGDPGFAFRILIADRDSMSSDLLASALTRGGNCQAFAVPSADLLNTMASGTVHLVVIGADLDHDTKNGFELAQTVNRVHPAIPIVILLNQSTHDSVTDAFRSGARGVFSRQQPMADFIECVEHVRKGFIWAGATETILLLDALSSIPPPNLFRARASESSSLSVRELQVIKCAAKGKTNKVIAGELGLSEHTVKNYLFRAFEKLGVSKRVELLFSLTSRDHALDPRRSGDPEADSKEQTHLTSN